MKPTDKIFLTETENMLEELSMNEGQDLVIDEMSLTFLDIDDKTEDYIEETFETSDISSLDSVPEEVINRLHMKNTYDSGYGMQHYAGWITFKNTSTWVERREYDGKEWWKVIERPHLER